MKLALDLRNSLNFIEDTKLCHKIIRHSLTLQNLEHFSLLVNRYSIKDLETSSVFSVLTPNKFIKKFTFENETRDNNNLLIALLQLMPKLNYLELAVDYDELILTQLPLMKKLRCLKLTDYHQGLLKSIKCTPSLESIFLKYCKFFF